MQPLRFAIIGCGGHSTAFQLPAVSRSPLAALTAVVDADATWANTVARRFRAAAAFSDFREVIGRVDAAIIATPNTTHADIASVLLEHGIHVLCEKPVSTSLTELDRMAAAAAASGARLMGAHCLRFSANIAMLKQAIAAGWLGDIVKISGAIGTPYANGAHRTDFRKNRRLSGGGVLVDLGIHMIDLAIWLVDSPPVRVAFERENAEGWAVETDACIDLEFAGASRATLNCSFTSSLENALMVRGTAGWARASLYDPTELMFFSESARICQKDGAQRIVLPPSSMYDQQIAHFCEAVHSGGEFLVAPHELRAGISVVENCYANDLACV
jgi:predicted dehydrogenase